MTTDSPCLTFAQADVLRRLSVGQSYKQIAAKLQIKRGTVWRHAQMARAALGARTIIEAAVIYATGKNDNCGELADRVNW